MMPEMNGFAFTEHFKKLRNHATTPFVYVTALSDFKTRSNSVLTGGCDFIAKPFTPSEVAVKAFTVALKGRLAQLAATKAKNKLPDCSQGEALGVSMERFCGVICLNREGFIRTINQDCVEMLGYSSTEIVGKHLHELFPPELQSGLKVSVLKHIEMTGDGQGIEVIGRRKDSSQVKLAICSSETKSNGTMLLVALIRYVLNEEQD
jgi:PAS domain S-box-containing protein